MFLEKLFALVLRTSEKAEIMAAIRYLKSGKAIAQDSLNAEMFKAEPERKES